jgi:hypothetical protein
MRLLSTILTILLLTAVVYIGHQTATSAAPPPTPPADNRDHRPAASLQAKLDYIHSNGQQPRPDQTPTIMTEDEVNDYLNSGRVDLPQGVKKVTLQGQSGAVTGFVNVDFDEIRSGQRSSNPLLSIFSGRHDVRVDGDVAGSGGQGKVHVRSVSIDGIDVPRVALEFFVQKYVTSKYPNVGLDSEFKLPNRIDLATVGYHKLTVTQK